MEEQRPWRLFHTIILVLVVLALIFIGVFSWPLQKDHPESRLLAWWIIVALFSISLATIGHGLLGRPFGAFIDERNRMSLSRLQLVVWTIVILSGFLTIALWNLHTPGNDDPLNIGMPEQLWWLLGISTTSLVGSPLIKSAKKNTRRSHRDEFERKKVVYVERRGERFKNAATMAAPINAGPPVVPPVAGAAAVSAAVPPGPAPGAPAIPVAGAAAALAASAPAVPVPATGALAAPAAGALAVPAAGAIGADGQLVKFSSPDMASPADLFEGEETGNFLVMDMGKVQMFYFTIILVLTYTIALLNVLVSKDVSVGFPDVSESMVALLGISHAGYLATKAASHTPTVES